MERLTGNNYLFETGRETIRLNKAPSLSELYNLSVFYRLGALYEQSKNAPTRQLLIDELIREFSYASSVLPNSIQISLKNHYSHRLIKTTLRKIGYSVSSIPRESYLHRFYYNAWRQEKVQ